MAADTIERPAIQRLGATDQPLNEAAVAFVTGGPKQLLIGGNWAAAQSGETFECFDPSTGRTMCRVATGGAGDIDRAVKAARRAFDDRSWTNMTPYARGNCLHKIGDLIEQHADELATIQSLDMGMLFGFSKMMTLMMADVFRYYAGWPTKIYGNTFPSDGSYMTYTNREPLGVVGAIIPWNGPVLATAWKIAPALACGNTIVLKPAEQAPLTSLRMAELILEAGLREGVVNVVTGLGEDAGAALVAHRDVDKISFTGSTAVGQGILVKSAETLKKVTLELGGKSPTIIFADADLNKAIPGALLGFTAGAGQGCVCGTRIFVHESVYQDVAAKIVQAAQGMTIGSPFDAMTQLGPLTSQEQLDRVTGYVAIGRSEGAQLAHGGDRKGEAGYFVKPAVFTGVDKNMRIYKEEIFGPVATLVPFKDDTEVVLKGNETSYGLAASIWTKDIARAHTTARALQAGIVWVNTTLELDAMAPFGGYKMSGVGRELGPDSMHEYTQVKTVVVRY